MSTAPRLLALRSAFPFGVRFALPFGVRFALPFGVRFALPFGVALLAAVAAGCTLDPCTGDDFSCGSEGRWSLVTIEGIDPSTPPDPRTRLSGSLDLDDGQGGYADLPLGTFADTTEIRARGVFAGRYSPRDHEGDNGTWELVFGLGGAEEPLDFRGEVEQPFDGETFRLRIFDSDFEDRRHPLLRSGQTLVFRRIGS